MTREEALKIMNILRFGTFEEIIKTEEIVNEALDEAIEALKERPHGKWTKGDPWTTGVGMGEQYGYYYYCSECGYKVKGGYTSCGIKFCQECGSDNRNRSEAE